MKHFFSVVILSLFTTAMAWGQSDSTFFTWVHGDSTLGAARNAGTINVPASTNTPGGRYNGCLAVADNGDIYYFGGRDGSGNYLADLWKWDGTYWIWIGGSLSLNGNGVYGTKGIADPGNVPPARYLGAAWVADNGDFYVFGGYRPAGSSDDVWKFDGANWTWIAGSSAPGATMVSGGIGVFDPSYTPGAGYEATVWKDGNGDLMLFGGYLSGSSNGNIWKFDVATDEWGLMFQAPTKNPSFGTINVTASTNHPGYSYGGFGFDGDGDDFYYYGGYGYTSTGNLRYREALWKWDGTNWTWIHGSNIDNTSHTVPNYGTRGVASSTNKPGTRAEGGSGYDPITGDLWIYGGYGSNSVSGDFWRFDGTDWIWEGGTTSNNSSGKYGTKGIPSYSNYPRGSYTYIDTKFAFKGEGEFYFVADYSGKAYNDVWKVGLNVFEDVWTTSWSLGYAPNDTITARIASSGSPGSFECATLKIDEGVTLTIGANDTVKIHGEIVQNLGTISGTGYLYFSSGATTSLNNGGAIDFEGNVIIEANTTVVTNDQLRLTASSNSSYGELFMDGTATLDGDIIMQQWLNLAGGSTDGRYFHLGSPLSDVTFSELQADTGAIVNASNTTQGSVWGWDASASVWEAPADLNELINPGQGYAVYAGSNIYGDFVRDDAGTIEFKGGYAPTSFYSFDILYHNGQNTSVSFAGGTGVSATQGWNFLANPFPSQIDWDKVTVPGGVGTATYLWDGSVWHTHVQGGGETFGRYLAPFQGFWIQNNGGGSQQLRIYPSSVVSTTQEPLALSRPDQITLVAKDVDKSVENRTSIIMNSMATKDFDLQYDARKLKNSDAYPTVGVRIGNDYYDKCQLPAGSVVSFPVKLDYIEQGANMMITVENTLYSAGTQAILEDLKENKLHDLLASDYAFVHDPGYNNNERFILHLKNGRSVDMVEEKVEEHIYATMNSDVLSIFYNTSDLMTYSLYNSAGQLITKGEGSRHIRVPAGGMASGVYILKVMADGKMSTIKLMR